MVFVRFFVLLAAVTSTAAHAQMPDVDIPYDRFELDNGLTVIVHEDRKAPVVAVSVWYDVGSRDEPAGKTGFAHLFEHLMFNGSENFDGEWFEPLEEVGATGLNGTTWLDRTNYFQTVPTPALDRVLWLESDRMGHFIGAVTQDKLDSQRGVVQNEKRQGDNQPYGMLRYHVQQGLFPEGHPYHHSTIGSMEDLNAASLETVQQWFRDYYGPNNAVLVLAGDIDVATARERVERYFADIPAGPQTQRPTALLPVREHDSAEFIFDEVPSARATRVWATPGLNDEVSAHLSLAAAILGQGKNSRLYRELVYDRQVATDASAYVSPFVLASIARIDVVLKPGVDVAEATQGMDRVLAEFLDDGPTEEELNRVKTRINADVVRGLERVGGFSGKAVTLAEGELYSGAPDFWKTRLEWLNSASRKDVLDAARRWMSTGSHQVDVLPRPEYAHAEAGVDRSTGLPAVNDTPELIFPAIEEFTLRNGVKVHLARRDAVPVVNIAMQFDAGFAADAGGKLGLSGFTLDMMDEGAGELDALQIAARAEELGAEVSTGSSLDVSSVTLSALKSKLEDSLDLWATVIREPRFAQAELERLRAQTVATIAQEKSRPRSIALRLLPPAMYGDGHAYGIPLSGSGTEASIATINRDDLLGFHRSWIRPSNGRIFVVGDTTVDEIKPLLERTIGRWVDTRMAVPRKNIATVSRPATPRVAIVDRPGSPQSYIIAGQVVPPPGADNDLAIDMMNEILGGAFTARINMNLREDKGWAYFASTGVVTARGQRPWIITAPVQSDRTGDALREIVAEIQAFQSDRPATDVELERNVLNNTRALPGRFETADAVLRSMARNAGLGRPLDYAASLKQRYDALTLDDVNRAARETIDVDSLIWVIVGDREVIEEQVKGLGIAPIEFWDTNGEVIQ
jgi:zinc protease